MCECKTVLIYNIHFNFEPYCFKPQKLIEASEKVYSRGDWKRFYLILYSTVLRTLC